MDRPPSPGSTETLANLSVLWILAIVAGLTVLRLGLIRVPTPGVCCASEILEFGIIAIVLVFLIIRPFVVQAYFIPSPSMEPTLLGKEGSGDRILVNKFDYRLRHPPMMMSSCSWPPKRMGWKTPTLSSALSVFPATASRSSAARSWSTAKRYKHVELRQALAEAGRIGDEARQDIAVRPSVRSPGGLPCQVRAGRRSLVGQRRA